MNMESSIPQQRSNTNTPQHHNYYSGPDQQPKSFTNSLVSNHSQQSYLNAGGGHVIEGDVRRTTPRLYTPTNYSGGRKNRRSRTQSPRSQSSSGGDGGSQNILISNSSLHHLSSTPIHNHHQQQLHDDDNINLMINSSGGGSHSITPPNSNSNTTISCGSGNSTSVNIGVPIHSSTTPKSTLNHINHHNNNNNNNNNCNNTQRQTDLENLRNKSNKASPKPKAKKCILEEQDDGDVEQCANKAIKQGARCRNSWVLPNQEFLPICDALFNVISLAAYFCDIVFDVLTAYTWYKMSQETEDFLLLDVQEAEQQRTKANALWVWSVVALVFIICSTLLSQTLSFKWYKQSTKRGQIGPDGMDLQGPPTPCSTSVLVMMHVSLCGVLWRYFKLFIPVDLRFVKNEVRDLCLLRLVHAFCEAIPMLLIQLYLIWGSSGPQEISDFTIVSTSLSLFSVCWALASFSKNIRKQNVHKLVLTWLGVIFQFGWHLGTIISRVVALSLYATVYHFWIFLVLILHWFCMLLWLISPKNLYHGEKLSTLRKIMYSTLLAVVYTFCYINVQENNSRQPNLIYYVTMFLENSLLLSVWLIAKRYEDEIWYKTHVISAVFLCFGAGILFMICYYRFFHLKRLSYVYDTESSIYRSTSVLNGGSSSVNINGAIYPSSFTGSSKRKRDPMELSNSKNINNITLPNTKELLNGTPTNGFGMVIENNNGSLPNHHNQNNGNMMIKKTPERYNKRPNNNNNNNINGLKSDKIVGSGLVRGGSKGATNNKINGYHIHHPNVHGVFNCRFNPAMKRKKKKPTSFVPPPAVLPTTASSSPSNHNEEHQDGENSFPHQNTLHSINRSINSGHNANEQCVFGGSLLLDSITNESLNCSNQTVGSGDTSKKQQPKGRMSHPFWKRPLSIASECSVGSRVVDIQQKLQEKKQQQLNELKEIEEEIKQGKLKRPQFNEIPHPPVTVCQPIPAEKKKPWFRQQHHPNSMDPPLIFYPRPPFMIPGLSNNNNSNNTTTIDPNANEVILDPSQYLMYASPTLEGGSEEYACYYDNPDWPIHFYEPEPMYENEDDVHDQDHSSGSLGVGGIQRRRRGALNQTSKEESIYKSYRMHSDIDSQMSLPRSSLYSTLPREFKYKKKFRKPIKNEQFLPSTNSSDGDVDSGEEDSEIYGPFPLPLPSIANVVPHTKSRKKNNNDNNMPPLPPNPSCSVPQPSKKHHPIILSRRQQRNLHETKL